MLDVFRLGGLEIMTEKRFTKKEISKIVHIVDDNFTKWYMMATTADKLTLSERLLFDSIRESIVNGVDYDLENLKDIEKED